MKNEIEAQFLDINKDEIRAKLKKLDAELVKPEVLMRRTVFYTGEHSFARVRDEGDKIVMTYKNVSDDHSILGTKEVNIEVNDYDDAILFLRGCGLKVKARQETKREIWKLGKVEICIDTWPWIPTFMEIEGPSEKSVWDTAKKLGFSKQEAKFGSVDTTYQCYYGIDTDTVNMHTPEILFDMKPPKWAQNKSMNKLAYIAALKKLNLPKSEFIILSGGSLLMHGLRDTTADLDLCATKKLAKKIDLYNSPIDDKGFHTPFENCQMMDDFDKFEYDIVDGYKCETLESILAFKRRANRPKDQQDIKNIEKALGLN
ncbi:class IV adenylate cyclase [Candidatus Saccharibacteria bacterium]|nr:class IV adenylate cyclase [Candidatus Saccharibacteria bacterium]